MCLKAEIHVIHKCHSRMTCRAVGHEFYVSKSTIYHISEKDEEICQYVHEVALESSNVHDEPMEKTKNLLNCG